MATGFVLKDATIAWDGDDISGQSNNVVMTPGYNTEVVNGFGDDTEINIPTIRTIMADVSGFYEPTTIDAAIGSHQSASTNKNILTIIPQGSTSGNVAYLIKAHPGDYNFGENFGAVLKFSLPFMGNADWTRGTLADTGAQTTGAGTGINLGALSATQTLVSHLHVLSGSSTTVDAVVESDADNTFVSAVTRLTHTQIANTGSDRQSATGAITDTWFRFNFTVSGSVTILASFGIVG